MLSISPTQDRTLRPNLKKITPKQTKQKTNKQTNKQKTTNSLPQRAAMLTQEAAAHLMGMSQVVRSIAVHFSE